MAYYAEDDNLITKLFTHKLTEAGILPDKNIGSKRI